MMTGEKRFALRALPLCLFGVVTATAAESAAEETGFHVGYYGSLRVQAEAVRPDDRSVLSSYTGLRDAYSRLGFKAHYQWENGTRLFGQLELPFDVANMRMHDPYDQGGFGRSDAANVRIGKIGLSGRFGTLAVGQQWLPYYNAIAAPVDWFSTYYSGFATYTSFRIKDTVAYYSPELAGFSFALSHSEDQGNRKSTARIDDRRVQGTLSYAWDDFTVSAGIDDRGNAQGYRDRVYGLSASFSRGNWYAAGKYERTDTDNPNSFFGDDAEAFNLLGAYTLGRNTFKLMLARVENYGDNIVHLGIDHRYADDLVLFAEYYGEQESAALTERRRGLAHVDPAFGGGQAVAVGLRYSF